MAGIRKKPIVQAPRMTSANSMPEQIHGIPDHLDSELFLSLPTAITQTIPKTEISMK
jgi:hypothetical protein